MNILYWLLCIVIGLIPAALIYRKDRHRQIPVRWLPAALRFCCFFFTAALLLAPVFRAAKTVEIPSTIIWLQDQSLSTGKALGGDSSAYRQEVTSLWKSWKKNHDVVPLSFGSRIGRDTFFSYRAKSTNITGALQQVFEQYQDRNIGAVILATDGNFNQGLNPLFADFPGDIPIYTVGLGDSSVPADIRISKTYANKSVALHHQFEIIADIQADKLAGTSSEALLLHHGKVAGRSPIVVTTGHYTGSVQFVVKAGNKGLQHYQVVVSPIAKETHLLNNKKDVYVEVIEKKKKILLLAAAPHPDIAAIKAALQPDDQYEVTVRYSWNLPENISGYQLIIAHQLPSVGQQPAFSAAGLPVWYILGGKSSPTTFSTSQSLLQLSGTSGQTGAVVYADLRPFSYFTLPRDLSGVLEKMPPLQVPAGNFNLSSTAQVLLWGTSVATGKKVPLWIFQQQGTPTSILTGVGIWRWRIFDYKNNKNHESVDALIRQTVRFLTARPVEQVFRVFTRQPVFRDDEAITIYGALRNASGALINTPEPELLLEDSTGKTTRYHFEKDGNRYRLNLGVLAAGAYTYQGNVRFGGSDYKSSGAFQVAHQSRELMKSHANYALLYQLAHRSGGKFLTIDRLSRLDQLLKSDPHLTPLLREETVDLQLIDKKWFFLLILCCAVAEWLLRKYWSI